MKFIDNTAQRKVQIVEYFNDKCTRTTDIDTFCVLYNILLFKINSLN